jgi:hypothetical protein
VRTVLHLASEQMVGDAELLSGSGRSASNAPCPSALGEGAFAFAIGDSPLMKTTGVGREDPLGCWPMSEALTTRGQHTCPRGRLALPSQPAT